VSRDSLRTGNLFGAVPARLEVEETTVLAELPGARIERIVSTAQASPPFMSQEPLPCSEFPSIRGGT